MVQVVIELVLRLMNFPSDLLASIIEHVTSAIAAIREDPVRFLMNMLEALKRGILSFVDHIATHLLDGLASWLFRGLGQLGIQRPPDLSLQSIITLVLQVLGLSMDLVWAKLEERLGAETVGRIRGALDMLSGAWGFIKDVQERGITAIWEFISGQLSNLWDTIISAAQAWIQDRIVSAVVEKLVSMLDPTGVMAVVNSFLAFFRAVQSLIDYIREVLELVNEYVTTLDEVAHGNVDPAAAKVENGLAMATPMAIGFLANQVGIGNIPEKIVEIITSVRGVVEQAVAWLIDQAITLGQSALAALGVGGGAGHPEQAAASTGAGSGWLYEVPDHGHTIRVSHGFEVFRFSEPELLPPIDAHAKVQAILESMVPRIAVTYPTDGQRRAIGPSGHVTGCKDGEGRSSMPPVPNLPGGAAAYEAGDVRGHLVGDRFYGTAVDGNLVPMHTTLNGSTFLAFETQQANRYRRAVADGHGALLHWTVTPNYPTSGNVFRPVSITATATLITLQPNGASLAPTQVPITTTLSNPASAAGPVDLNTADRTTLLAMWQGQISTDHHDLVDAIIASRPIRDEVAFTFDLAQRAGVHRAPRFEHLLASRIGRMVR